MNFHPSTFFDFAQTDHRTLFDNAEYAWEPLKQIANYLQFRLKPAMLGSCLGTPYIGPSVFVGQGTVIEHGACIKGPAWIGDNCQIRAGCYIRENVVIGNGVVAGNSCEFKNCILFNGCEVPHFNYVGDSILGYKAHLGAGVILGNVKLDRQNIVLRHDGVSLDTGLRKFGAIIGDKTEIGCNSMINPGSILGRNCLIYPLTQWKGVLEENHVVKTTQNQTVIRRLARS